jgi:apolipoprotein N-acyltransferase
VRATESLARQLTISILAGAALGAAFPKIGWHPLVWVAIAPLLVVASEARPLRACALGLAFGMAYRSVTLYWLVYAMTRFGGLPLAIAIVAAGLLVFYLAAFWGLFALIAQRVGLRSHAAPLQLAAVWTGLAWLEGWLMSGFPWAAIGYAAGHTSLLAQAADLAGVHLLSFLAMLVNASLAAAVVRGDTGRYRPLLAAAGALVVAAGYGGLQLSRAPSLDAPPATGSLRVAMVQGNVEQQDKWSDAARATILEDQLRLSSEAAAAGADLVVWPESAWPDPWGIERNLPVAERLLAIARSYGTSMLVGTVHVYEEEGGIEVSNAGVLYDGDGAWRGRYEKRHLVPFGEYLPFRPLLGFLGPLVQAVGELRAGAADQPLLAAPEFGIPPLGLSVCYEIIFPYIARGQVRAGAQLLVTITNDAWYGTTSAPYQHFAMARMRAIENRRYLVRAANTGISGVFDPWGRVVASTGLFEQTVLMASVRPRTGLTPYAATGDLLGIACALFALWQLGAALHRRERAA